MYSRAPSRDFRVPTNYGGSAFRENTPTQAQDLTRRQPQYKNRESDTYELSDRKRENLFEQSRLDTSEESNEKRTQEEHEHICESCDKYEHCECDSKTDGHPTAERPHRAEASLFPSIGALGSEEILLIALALIIFQSGKEPELALILLALLFIN